MYKIAFFGSTLISEKIRIRAEPILEVGNVVEFYNKNAFQ